MSMKHGVIYMVTNKTNGKSYIGKTINLKARKKYHFYQAFRMMSSSIFHRAIRKYSKSGFEWRILFEAQCHKNKLNALEVFFIAYYKTFENGYNMTMGGEGGDTWSTHPNKKTLRKGVGNKISKALQRTDEKTGLTIAQLRGIKTRKTNMMIGPDGLTGYQRGSIKSAKTMSEIDEKTGISTYQIAAEKRNKTMNQIDPLSGLNMYQQQGLKHSITLNRIDGPTGKTIAKLAGEKVSLTKRLNGTHSGTKNWAATKYLFIAPNGQLIGSHGRLRQTCNKYGISRTVLLKNKGKKIKEPNKKRPHLITEQRIRTTGWALVKI